MITLTITIFLIYFYSIYDINKQCKAKNEPFNPLATSLFNWVFFAIGTGCLIIVVVFLLNYNINLKTGLLILSCLLTLYWA